MPLGAVTQTEQRTAQSPPHYILAAALGFPLLCLGDTGFLLRQRLGGLWDELVAQFVFVPGGGGLNSSTLLCLLIPADLILYHICLSCFELPLSSVLCPISAVLLDFMFCFCLSISEPIRPLIPCEASRGAARALGTCGEKYHFGPHHLNTANHANPKNIILCRRGSIFCSVNWI